MEKIRVGMIDSGINQCVIRGTVTQEIFCGRDSDAYRAVDINGHGTMCAKVVENMSAAELEFVSAKIFHGELKATERQIVEALTYMMDMRVDVINMSLSVSLSESPALCKICRQLDEAGVILVSAAANSGKKTLFEEYGNVVTVTGSSFFDGGVYWHGGNRAVCDIESVLLPWYEKAYRFFGGNSKAAALFTGIVINTGNIETERFELNTVKCNAVRKTWKQSDLCRDSMELAFAANKRIRHTKSMDQPALMRYVERATEIPTAVLEREEDWYADNVLLTADQVRSLLDELCTDSVLEMEEDVEIFMEYFRNRRSYLRFMGC